MKIAVIGAGASGIAAARQLQKAGLAFNVFERTRSLGGNWRFEPDNSHASVFANTHANTSKQIMGFSDCEMPASFPDYPHHSQLLEYLREYARRFKLTSQIRTLGDVERVEPIDQGSGGWSVRLADGTSQRYQAVCVATGHHWSTRIPELPGTFSGSVCHAKEYGNSQRFRGQRVLVVGLGASGADITVDLSRVAADVHVAVRRGYHIVPKIVMGRPLDHFAFERKKSFLPRIVRNRLTDKVLLTLIGDGTRFGFPAATHSLRSVSPTISSELLGRIAEGTVRIRPGVARLEGDRVVFVDQTSHEYDAIVYATGYRVSVPFLDQSVLDSRSPYRMYKHVVHPDFRNLYFIGFVQPLGAFWPIAEAQGGWVAALLTGAAKLPDRAQMRNEIDTKWRAFLAGKPLSHETFIQVEQDTYLLDMHRSAKDTKATRQARAQDNVAPFTRLVWERIARANAASRMPATR